MLLVVSHNRSFLNEVANKIAVIAHQRLAVFQGTFKDSWAAAKMAEFMAVKQKPRYCVLRMVKDWETGTSYYGGDVIALQGAETQAFVRLLRWAEANGRVERIETYAPHGRCTPFHSTRPTVTVRLDKGQYGSPLPTCTRRKV